MLFGAKKLNWRTYITTETIFTAKQVELIDKQKFIKVALDKNFKIFVIYVIALEALAGITIYLFGTAQVLKK